MPEGIEGVVTVEQIADLIAFLLPALGAPAVKFHELAGESRTRVRPGGAQQRSHRSASALSRATGPAA